MSDTRYFINGRARRTDDAKPASFFGAPPKSDKTVREEKVALAYERRSNICQSCFTARSLTGECSC
jgi:hypothetical protein